VIVVALPEGHFMQLAVTFAQAEVAIQLSVITSQMYPELQAQAKGVPPLGMELGNASLPQVMQVVPPILQIDPVGQKHS
jgi:hypothetical protein